MSLQLRSSTRIPSRSSSAFMLLAFLLVLTLPQQHLAEGEGAAPAWRRVPYTPQRAIAVSWSQERERTLPAPSYNLVSSAAAPSSARAATELRCVCLTLTPRINPKMIANLEVIPAGPQCPTVEVLAKLKNQKDVCLDPEAPLIKKIIQKILDSEKKKTKRNAHAMEKSASIQ